MAFITHNGVRKEIEGSPPGTTAHILDADLCEEMKRMFLFRRDLERASEWLDYRTDDDDADKVYAGLDEAAIIAFCRCFKGNKSGPNKLRKRPLSEKIIFNPEQRQNLGKIKLIRDKIVAHDEELTGGYFVIILMNKEFETVGVNTLGISGRFTTRAEKSNLRELVGVCRAWVETEYERIAFEIKLLHDELPIEVRKAAPPVIIEGKDHDIFA